MHAVISLGGNVAIAEQVGEVGAAKGPVERKVVRVVTPGTLTDTELLSDKTESMLLAVHQGPRARCGLAWLSVTQGRVHLAECSQDELTHWLGRVAPSEVIYSAGVTERFEQQLQVLRQSGAFTCPMSLRPDWQFDSALGERKLLEYLGAASLQAWGAQDLGEAHAAADEGERHQPPKPELHHRVGARGRDERALLGLHARGHHRKLALEAEVAQRTAQCLRNLGAIEHQIAIQTVIDWHTRILHETAP